MPRFIELRAEKPLPWETAPVPTAGVNRPVRFRKRHLAGVPGALDPALFDVLGGVNDRPFLGVPAGRLFVLACVITRVSVCGLSGWGCGYELLEHQLGWQGLLPSAPRHDLAAFFGRDFPGG